MPVAVHDRLNFPFLGFSSADRRLHRLDVVGVHLGKEEIRIGEKTVRGVPQDRLDLGRHEAHGGADHVTALRDLGLVDHPGQRFHHPLEPDALPLQRLAEFRLLGYVANVEHDTGDGGVIEQVPPPDTNPPDSALVIEDPDAVDSGFTGMAHQVLEGLAGVGKVVGVDVVLDVDPLLLIPFRVVPEHLAHIRAGVAHGAIRTNDVDQVGGVLDQRPEPLFLAQELGKFKEYALVGANPPLTVAYRPSTGLDENLPPILFSEAKAAYDLPLGPLERPQPPRLFRRIGEKVPDRHRFERILATTEQTGQGRVRILNSTFGRNAEKGHRQTLKTRRLRGLEGKHGNAGGMLTNEANHGFRIHALHPAGHQNHRRAPLFQRVSKVL